MHRIIVLAAVVIVSLASCSKERETGKVEHEKMGGHGMAVDWKFSLPQGNPAEGRKVFVVLQVPRRSQR